MYPSIRPLFIRLNCYFEMKKNVVSFLVSLLQWISCMLVSIYFTSVFTIFILDLELFRPCGIVCFFILCFSYGCFESWALFIIKIIANVKWRTVNNQCFFWRVWRYQSGNQNPYIAEEQTTQWPKEKLQKDKQRSTKHTHKSKDRAARTPLKPGGELMCFGMVGTCGTRRVNLVTNPVISYEWWKDREVFTLVSYSFLCYSLSYLPLTKKVL